MASLVKGSCRGFAVTEGLTPPLKGEIPMSEKAALLLSLREDAALQWEVLFTPILNWELAACAAAGVSASVVTEETSDAQIRDFLGDARDVLILDGAFPLLDGAVIGDALRQHRGEHNVLTEIGGRDAVWLQSSALPGGGVEGMQKALASRKERARFSPADPDVCLRVRTRLDLLKATQKANGREIARLLEAGVEFLGTDGVLIGPDCRVGRGTRILPGTILRQGTQVGEDCILGPNSLLSACTVGDRAVVNASQGYEAEIGPDVTVGPFCHLRPGTKLLAGVHIGDFVEVKNSVVGEGTHISHLTYVGDSDVGRGVNFGCGVATANYNGVTKSRCRIGDGAFIGCNTNLVAPVSVGENGYTAAGSTITEDVPAESLAIARARQVNKAGYNRKLRPGTGPTGSP